MPLITMVNIISKTLTCEVLFLLLCPRKLFFSRAPRLCLREKEEEATLTQCIIHGAPYILSSSRDLTSEFRLCRFISRREVLHMSAIGGDDL